MNTRVVPSPVLPLLAAALAGCIRDPSLVTGARRPADAPVVWSTGSISGFVRDAAGGPIEAARVVAYADDVAEAQRIEDAEAVATTGAGGSFALPLPSTGPRAMVYVEAAGYSPALVRSVAPGDDVLVTLGPPRTFSGRVTDGRGAPVEGARVRWLSLLDAHCVVREATSDEAGRFAVRGLPSLDAAAAGGFIDRWFVEVDAVGFAPLFVEPDELARRPSEAPALDLVVNRGVTVRGRVVDREAGHALPGARVLVRSRQGWGSYRRPNGMYLMNPFGRGVLREATAAADGSFELGPLPARGHHSSSRIEVGALEAHPAIGHVPTERDVPWRGEGEVIELDVRCRPGGGPIEPQVPPPPPCSTATLAAARPRKPAAIDLFVTDAAGDPIRGAFVRNVGVANVRHRRTGEDGRLRVVVEDVPVRLRIEAHRFAVASTGDLAPAPDDSVELHVVLEPERIISGRVLRADGSPAIGVDVFAADADAPVERAFGHGVDWTAGRPNEWTFASATTRSDGSFVVRGVPDGRCRLGVRETEPPAWPGGMRTSTLRGTLAGVAAGTIGVTFRLDEDGGARAAVDVEGTVVDAATGSPVEDFAVRLENGGSTYGAYRPRLGAFHLHQVPAGSWDVVVSAPGYRTIRYETLEVGATPLHDLFRLRLERGATIRGRVRVPPHVSLEEAELVVVDTRGAELARVPVGKDGRFGSSGFGPGDYRPYLSVPSGIDRLLSTSLVPRAEPVWSVPSGAGEVVVDATFEPAVRLRASVVSARLPSTGATEPFEPTGEPRANSAAWWLEVRDGAGRLVLERRRSTPFTVVEATVPSGDYTVILHRPVEGDDVRHVAADPGSGASVRFEIR